jgi:hypothetical protein
MEEQRKIKERSNPPSAAKNINFNESGLKKQLSKMIKDSQFELGSAGHEEGGWIVRNSDGTYGILRWARDPSHPSRIGPSMPAPEGTVGEVHTHFDWGGPSVRVGDKPTFDTYGNIVKIQETDSAQRREYRAFVIGQKFIHETGINDAGYIWTWSSQEMNITTKSFFHELDIGLGIQPPDADYKKLLIENHAWIEEPKTRPQIPAMFPPTQKSPQPPP